MINLGNVSAWRHTPTPPGGRGHFAIAWEQEHENTNPLHRKVLKAVSYWQSGLAIVLNISVVTVRSPYSLCSHKFHMLAKARSLMHLCDSMSLVKIGDSSWGVAPIFAPSRAAKNAMRKLLTACFVPETPPMMIGRVQVPSVDHGSQVDGCKLPEF